MLKAKHTQLKAMQRNLAFVAKEWLHSEGKVIVFSVKIVRKWQLLCWLISLPCERELWVDNHNKYSRKETQALPQCRGFFFISDLFTKEIGLNLGKEMTVFRISWSGRFYFFWKVLFFDIYWNDVIVITILLWKIILPSNCGARIL